MIADTHFHLHAQYHHHYHHLSSSSLIMMNFIPNLFPCRPIYMYIFLKVGCISIIVNIITLTFHPLHALSSQCIFSPHHHCHIQHIDIVLNPICWHTITLDIIIVTFTFIYNIIIIFIIITLTFMQTFGIFSCLSRYSVVSVIIIPFRSSHLCCRYSRLLTKTP